MEAFNSLPIELNKTIAHYLGTDEDIKTYRLICQATNDAIDADNHSFWRAKFSEKYDTKAGVSNIALAKLYQVRAVLLQQGLEYDFFRGHKKGEKAVVKMLRDLVIESFQGASEVNEYGRSTSKNQDHLKRFVLNSQILFNSRRAPPPSHNEPADISRLLAAIRLICSQFIFELEGGGTKHEVFAIEESQYAVYLPTNTAPLYGGSKHTNVNMQWMLHNFNFFRYHMTNQEIATLYENIDALPMTQKPSAWCEPLREGVYPLGKHWKGTYAYLDQSEVRKIRKLGPDQVGEGYFTDKNVEEGKIQSLELDFVQDGRELTWPQIFESRLRSLRNVAKPSIKTQGRSKSKQVTEDLKASNIQFTGQGIDLDDDFSAIGWINALPPQAGIPGWQRITFMKHFMDDFDQVEQDNLWAYEGVVLPGGRMILGRWWYASDQVDFDNDYNGPFILWALDPELDLSENGEE